MRPLNVFRYLTSADSRLGFYTKENKETIPEVPGCYAWFLPLWFYRSDLNELIRIISRVFDYDNESEREVYARFNWESVKLRVRRNAETEATRQLCKIWERLCADERAKRALQQTLLEASLLMPPLYVGRTRSLKQRYLQHTAIKRRNQNDFHSRFIKCVSNLELTIGVSDLLFVCISTERNPGETPDGVNEDDRERLIEQILMNFCRPPFSLR